MNVSFEIFCKGRGHHCSHLPVEWFIDDEKIIFGRDNHFQEEQSVNRHTFKISKVEPDDEGTIKVKGKGKSQSHERECTLQVVSKYLNLKQWHKFSTYHFYVSLSVNT